ncbi:MAG: hypothetical protein ACO3JU_05320, partial [Pseudohongiellaceae bacterium]
ASTATPMSYVSPKSGRQYVIVTVPEGGGILQLETQVNEGGEEPEVGGGWVYAYALPESVNAP